MASLLTFAECTLELGATIKLGRSFVLQLPHDPANWPHWPELAGRAYVQHQDKVIQLPTLEDVEGISVMLQARGGPAVGVVVVPHSSKHKLYRLLGLDPNERDHRDILVLDSSDDGLNPLLEAAVSWADQRPHQTPNQGRP